ncbi:hypothetical protein FSS13T_01540 [Flavobacterium saliperosum S13]|uniref:Uncharacterized protein n=1 Tax=Flavobacterium saliperosum S13 TaxID=1341155 RepID=A0ABN0QIV7_9FLAO|nr:hypothetical protein FSS13T_01540 [Flavobacterium saliperosum S13]
MNWFQLSMNYLNSFFGTDLPEENISVEENFEFYEDFR